MIHQNGATRSVQNVVEILRGPCEVNFLMRISQQQKHRC